MIGAMVRNVIAAMVRNVTRSSLIKETIYSVLITLVAGAIFTIPPYLVWGGFGLFAGWILMCIFAWGLSKVDEYRLYKYIGVEQYLVEYLTVTPQGITSGRFVNPKFQAILIKTLELVGDCESQIDLTQFTHVKYVSLQSTYIKALPFSVDHLSLGCDNAECVNNSRIKFVNLRTHVKGITNPDIESLGFSSLIDAREFRQVMNSVRPIGVTFWIEMPEVFEILHEFDFVRKIGIYNYTPVKDFDIDLFDHIEVFQVRGKDLISTSRGIKLMSLSNKDE